MSTLPPGQGPPLRERLSRALEVRHRSRRTVKAYTSWVRRFILFHDEAGANLRSLRDASGMTQVAVSERSGIDQADISRLENRGDMAECQVATLSRYIAALGGELEVVARFGDKRITVVGSASAPDAPKVESNKR